MFSEMISRFLIDHLGKVTYSGLVVVLILVVPMVLTWLFLTTLIKGSRGPWFGLALGLAIATWASLSDLCVPYLGLYPNLPGCLLGLVLAGPAADATWVGQLCIHGTNFLLWPSLGWVAFRARRARNASRVNPTCV